MFNKYLTDHCMNAFLYVLSLSLMKLLSSIYFSTHHHAFYSRMDYNIPLSCSKRLSWRKRNIVWVKMGVNRPERDTYKPQEHKYLKRKKLVKVCEGAIKRHNRNVMRCKTVYRPVQWGGSWWVWNAKPPRFPYFVLWKNRITSLIPLYTKTVMEHNLKLKYSKCQQKNK